MNGCGILINEYLFLFSELAYLPGGEPWPPGNLRGTGLEARWQQWGYSGKGER